MFNFYVVSASHDKVSDTGRATTRAGQIQKTTITNKITKNEGPCENMGFNVKTV